MKFRIDGQYFSNCLYLLGIYEDCQGNLSRFAWNLDDPRYRQVVRLTDEESYVVVKETEIKRYVQSSTMFIKGQKKELPSYLKKFVMEVHLQRR